MFLFIINNYLKRLDVDKAVLIAKQFNIDFTYKEMCVALPFIQKNYASFLNENSKITSLNNLATISNAHIANKCEQLIDKLLIVFS